MDEIKYNYDREADVLYIGFARSEHVVSVELSDSLILRLDLRKEEVLSAQLAFTPAAPTLPELVAA